jgi:hypothetical protein
MLFVLVATLLADWRYEGFASDPARPEPVKADPAQRPPAVVLPHPGEAVAPAQVVPPPAPAPLPAPPPAPTAPAEAESPPVADPRLPSVPPPAPRKPGPLRVDAPSQPSHWHLADLSGQVWESPDPDRLRRWVAYRNASLAVARPRPLSRVRTAILSRRQLP